MPAFRQPSFAAGELAPAFWGRTDLARYGAGLRRLRNFFVGRSGAAISRPGTRYLGETLLSQFVRLLPFSLGDDDSIVIEAGDGYFRFWKGGSLVYSGASPVQIGHPYRIWELGRIRTAQVGDVLTLAHPDHPPRELVRLSDTAWTLSPLDFSIPDYAGREPVAVQPLPSADGTHPAKEWAYRVTMLGKRADGSIFESEPVAVTRSATVMGNTRSSLAALPAELVIYPDRPLVLDFYSSGLWSGTDYTPIATRIYRGRGRLFGFVGEVAGPFNAANAASGRFTDKGADPDYTRPPPEGRNPFEVRDVDGTVLRVERPAAVCHFEGRQWLGGTAERPDRLWGSAVDSLLDFDLHADDRGEDSLLALPGAEAALTLRLAARRREEIVSLLGLDRLIAFTGSSVWAVGTADGGPLSPTALPTARVQLEIGAAPLDPLVLGDAVLFARAKGSGVRDLLWSNDRRGFVSGDLTLWAEHLLAAGEITSWTYAEDPWGLVWATTADGRLLSLTYDREAELLAWAQHDTDGAVEAVCAVPEGLEDGVYLVVRRQVNGTTRRYVERMASRRIDEIETYCGLDAALSFDDAPTPVVGGLAHLEGKSVTVFADGLVYGPLLVLSGQVNLPAGKLVSRGWVGLPFTPEIELLDVPEGRDRPKVVKRVIWEVEASRGLWSGEAQGLWAGETGDDLIPHRGRTVVNAALPPLVTGPIEQTIPGRWEKGGRAVLQQRDPLPLTVLGVTRIGEVGGG